MLGRIVVCGQNPESHFGGPQKNRPGGGFGGVVGLIRPRHSGVFEPMVEFFPRNAEAGARYFWPNRATADRIALIKATMLAKSLQQAQQAMT